jgi:hypothetical protein
MEATEDRIILRLRFIEAPIRLLNKADEWRLIMRCVLIELLRDRLPDQDEKRI